MGLETGIVFLSISPGGLSCLAKLLRGSKVPPIVTCLGVWAFLSISPGGLSCLVKLLTGSKVPPIVICLGVWFIPTLVSRTTGCLTVTDCLAIVIG